MPNLSLFVTICRKNRKKINGNKSLQNISAPQYTFIFHRPLKASFNHNIHGYKGPENKNSGKKRTQNDQKCQIRHYFPQNFEKSMETSVCKK